MVEAARGLAETVSAASLKLGACCPISGSELPAGAGVSNCDQSRPSSPRLIKLTTTKMMIWRLRAFLLTFGGCGNGDSGGPGDGEAVCASVNSSAPSNDRFSASIIVLGKQGICVGARLIVPITPRHDYAA